MRWVGVAGKMENACVRAAHTPHALRLAAEIIETYFPTYFPTYLRGRNLMTKVRFYRIKNTDANGNVIDDAIVPAQSRAEVEDNCSIQHCRTEIEHLGFSKVQLQTNENLGSTYNAKEETEYKAYIENYGEISFSRDSVRENSNKDSARIQHFAVKELEKKCAKDLKVNQAKLDDIKKDDPSQF